MKNLSGLKFRMITVNSFHSKTNRWQTMWNCTCDCGMKKIIRGAHLIHGKTLSCGCLSLQKRIHRKESKTLLMSKTSTYGTYIQMIARCTNQKHPKYKSYGGRGIFVCDRWMESFKNFYEDMGERPIDKTIDRIDNNGPYIRDNCRWASRKQQQRNRRTNKILTFQGESHCLIEWSEITGITKKTIEGRLYRGWPIEKVFIK